MVSVRHRADGDIAELLPQPVDGLITSWLSVDMLPPPVGDRAALQNDLRAPHTLPPSGKSGSNWIGGPVTRRDPLLSYAPWCGGIRKESPTERSCGVLANSVALCVTGSRSSLEVTDKAGRRLCQIDKQCALREIRGAI